MLNFIIFFYKKSLPVVVKAITDLYFITNHWQLPFFTR